MRVKIAQLERGNPGRSRERARADSLRQGQTRDVGQLVKVRAVLTGTAGENQDNPTVLAQL